MWYNDYYNVDKALRKTQEKKAKSWEKALMNLLQINHIRI